MKAVLEFDLPAESDEHQTALDGQKWRSVVEDLDNWLRSFDKYQEPDKHPSVAEIRMELNSMIEAEGICRI